MTAVHAKESLGPESNGRRVVIRVHGIVQGVGFRPHIFQLARVHRVDGWVRNQSDGVEIEVSGGTDAIEAFIGDIRAKAPPLSRIVHLNVQDKPYAPLSGFFIVESRAEAARATLISPDTCTCADCLREVMDPRDRRYRYPFTNCTNCGPRYTIIRDIPYDRDKTTMARFPMCAACTEEYHDPGNRRFHAQPNACWDCGPRVWLEDGQGDRLCDRDEALGAVLRLLESGETVAVKGLGGFHLAVGATDETAVSRLRRRKIREEKPFAVMFPHVDAVKEHCLVSREEESLLLSHQRPIVLLRRKDGGARAPIAPSVAPNNRNLGVFLPYTPLHHLLLDGGACAALVMTSGNQSDEPIVMDNGEARERLRDIADFFLLHDRDIYMRCDDSVTRVIRGRPRPLRRARGYVPVPVFLREDGARVLGVGAELKNTVCLTRGKEAFLSQHVGDLENLETLRSFEHVIQHLQRVLEIEPQCIAHDLHPDYLGTRWALQRKEVPRVAVQHHQAHIAAVAAERHLNGPILGLAMDGTGYGTDGTIWGGEILMVEGARFKRLGHFRHLFLPGGDSAVKEPWRMALSALWAIAPDDVERQFPDFLSGWTPEKVRVVLQMLRRGVNTFTTSSCGRVFDAVSALVGLRQAVTYEGQAAIELEQAIEPDDGSYEGRLAEGDGGMVILDPLPMVRKVVEEIRGEVPRGVIAARFHNGMVSLLADAAAAASRKSGMSRVALSGGVFQNAYLMERLVPELEARGLEVHTHEEVPANDACIALGQAFVARQWLESG